MTILHFFLFFLSSFILTNKSQNTSNSNPSFVKLFIQTIPNRDKTKIPQEKYFDFMYDTASFYSYLYVGSNGQKLKCRISLSTYPTYISSKSLFTEPSEAIEAFDAEHSKSFQTEKNEEIFMYEEFYRAKESKDKVCVGEESRRLYSEYNSNNNNNNNKKDNLNLPWLSSSLLCLEHFQFAYATQMHFYSSLPVPIAQIGLQLFNRRFSQSEKFGFVNQLKSSGLIKNYLVTIYLSSLEEGHLLFGAEPGDIDKNYLNASETSIKARTDSQNFVEWGLNLKSITCSSFSDVSLTAKFSLNIDYIISTDLFSQHISSFFADKNCTKVDVKFASGAYMLLCPKSSNLTLHPLLSFNVSSLSGAFFSFTFGPEELFREDKEGNMRYQVVLFKYNPEQTTSYEWTLGKLFFLKYMTTLDLDAKLIKVYKKRKFSPEEEKKKNEKNFGAAEILFLICLLLFLSITAKKVFFAKNRRNKIRANELEENVLYQSEESIN